jgi:hypothetical protein
MCIPDIHEIAEMWNEHHEDGNKFREQLIYYRQVSIVIYGCAVLYVFLILLYQQFDSYN